MPAISFVPDPAPPVPLPPGMALGPLRLKWTKGGGMWHRECPVALPSDNAMHALWKSHRLAFCQRGFTMRSFNGKWVIGQWLIQRDGKYLLTPIGQEKVNGILHPNSLPMEEEEELKLDLPELPAGFTEKLFDYQVNPARQLLRALQCGEQEWGYPGAWDCSEMGTGKSYQSLAAALATGLEVGVICPISVIPSWKGVFRHFGQHPRFIRNWETLRTGKRDFVKLEHYTHPRTGNKMKRFRWELDPKDTVLLFDEAHYAKNVGKLNQGLVMAAARQRFPTICISGTLAADPTHMRATGRIVGLHKEGEDNYTRFLVANECYGTSVSGLGWKFGGGRDGRRALAGIHRLVFPKRGARVRIADLGDKFPESQVLAQPYETGETQAIKDAFADAMTTIRSLQAQGMEESVITGLRGKAYMKAWHESEKLKVNALCEMTGDELEAGRSVAIFVNFTDVRETLMRRLKTGCAIFGGQPQHHRERCIAEFQEDRARVIIANIDAGGVGVSLHDVRGVHPRTSIILPTNKVTSLTQALGRVHRAGGKSRSRQIIFFAADTIEEGICDNVRRKMGQITTINDGDMNPEAVF